ncbi:MAG: DUF4249 family protein, partial [Balneolaceae bacterium]|nr:DUF4249 family protein [Balneolaceae bacterium]
IILLLLFILFGCNPYEQDTYKEYVIVESYAIANDSLPPVRVFTTNPADEAYILSESVLPDANVQIILLDESGNGEEVFEYAFSSESGVYVAQNTEYKMEPRRTYRLDVNFDNRPEVIQATTTIPDDFEITNEIPSTLTYQGAQLQLILSPTVKTQPQNVFVFSAIALQANPDNLTPFYRASIDEDGVDYTDFEINSSGLINEANFDVNPDGTITLQYPWLGVAFYGETLIVTQSVDKNLVDLIRSQQVQLGGSTLSPGEIPNLIYRTEGGIGIFGSLSSDTVSTIFERRISSN